jgi:tetratricopeptide (TPR) repeat protein
MRPRIATLLAFALLLGAAPPRERFDLETGLAAGNLAMNMGDFASAEMCYRAAWDAAKAAGTEGTKDGLLASESTGFALFRLGRYSEADSVLAASLADQRRLHGPAELEAMTLNYRAECAIYQRRLQDALRLHEEALALRRKRLPGDTLGLAQSLNNVGSVHRALGDLRKALDFQKRSAALLEKIHPKPLMLDSALSNIGELYVALGEVRRGRGYLRRALNGAIAKCGKAACEDVAVAMSNLAAAEFKLGDYAAAETMIKGAMDVKEKALGPYHPRLADTLHSYVGLLRTIGGREAEVAVLERRIADIEARAR